MKAYWDLRKVPRNQYEHTEEDSMELPKDTLGVKLRTIGTQGKFYGTTQKRLIAVLTVKIGLHTKGGFGSGPGMACEPVQDSKPGVVIKNPRSIRI